ncbi:putative polygalacturonase [Morus notabilis]|uniref:Putative polygalacturonase n=1 Tax=Morus notabilis TaxID=981085 RepID=W9QKW2_9ROSA|nr:putative polygalacturonase [Morus notabilis]
MYRKWKRGGHPIPYNNPLQIITLFAVGSDLVYTNGIGYSQDIYNVQDFGATGNGQNDDSQAFLKAWNSACGTNKGTPIIRVPKGQTYLLNPLTFNGPCKSDSIRIQIDGNIVAPQTLAGWKAGCQYGRWLHFVQVNNLVISGTGTFDGRGSMWWRKATYPGCKAPTGLRFYRCDNLQLKGFTSVNSPNKHIVFQSCRNVFVDHLHIRAPSTSPNTDGIVISGSSQIGISESFIGTGDDCISIKSGSSYINITHVTCGPGHGIRYNIYMCTCIS